MVERLGESKTRLNISGSAPMQRTLPSAGQQRSGAFAKLLSDRLGEIKFSSHASARLASRGIRLGDEAMKKLQGAVDLAAAKGARDALVMVGDIALVVSVVNRTVVTAMDRSEARANVFTNIDSAVIT